MKHGSLTLFVALSAFLAGASSFADENISKCVNETARFDGIGPLTYADIVGPVGTHVVLSRRYPQLCQQRDAKACTGNAYLMPGDTVAVANIFGNFAHVQFIGSVKVTVGWVLANTLKVRASESSQSNFVFSDMKPYPTTLLSPGVRLTKGVGVPVCEAYLQRLNKSPFDVMHRPYCDRPEDDSVPGFSKLARVPLQPSEVNKLYKLAYNFKFPPRQYENDGEKDIRAGRVDVTKNVGTGLLSWRYDPPVDIFNDGVPANILMWRGVELGAWGASCGVEVSESGQGPRSAQMPIVFKAGDNEVDERATKLLIAHPIQQYDSAIRTGNLYSSGIGFRPVARAIGIFKYHDLYYMDGFFDIWGDAQNERRGRPALANTMAVFLHRDGVSRQICEYHLSGDDYPRP